MSDPSPDPVLVNRLNQPVELYLAGGHVVLPPRGRLSVAQAELASPHVSALFDARILGLVEPAPPAPTAQASDEPANEATEAPDETGDAAEREHPGNN